MPESGGDYLSRYYKIPVRTLGTTRVISITKYQSGDVWKDNWASKVYADLLRFLKKKDHYKGLSHYYSDDWFMARDHPEQCIYLPEKALHSCFNGKSSPERFGKALQLIDYYLMTANIPLQKVGWNRLVSLQEFADYYLGLDCNGFVGTYFSQVFTASKIGASTHCNDFDNSSTGGVKRQSIGEVKARDVLVREGGSGTRHVALIDAVSPCDSKSVWIQLVQSASSYGGLSATSERLSWKKAPADKKSQAGNVLSVKVDGYYDFNYVIGYPFAV